MILGVGTDLCDIRRIERALQRFGNRFIARCFTEEERASAEARSHPAARYAMFYAAKEACAKALGTGFRQGVFWRDIRLFSLPSGQPMIRLEGGAHDRLNALAPPGGAMRIDVSMTDEYPLAQAVVVISAMP
ncbi:MAG: holo-ACP synthase [Rhodospirillales bacterium RIFCSPLOWO2_12_FULL_67_15]|nr:MAG: holo-ACP synthase [Rhodospirillales bacterium RIFCSPLOWO2_12_FULL_67_15]